MVRAIAPNENIYRSLVKAKDEFNAYFIVYPNLIEDAKSYYTAERPSSVDEIDGMLSVIHRPDAISGYERSADHEDIAFLIKSKNGHLHVMLSPSSMICDPVPYLSCEELLYAYRSLNRLLFDYILSRPNLQEEIGSFLKRIYA